MQVVPVLLDALVPFVMNGRFWNDCKQFVADAEATGLSGTEKKAAVIKDLQAVFGDLSKFALDVGITLGLLYLRASHPEWTPLAEAIETKREGG